MYTSPSLSSVVNEIRRDKVVVPEGADGFSINQIISISWVFIYAELLCRTIRHGLILSIILLFIFVGFICLLKNHFGLLYFYYLIFYTTELIPFRSCQQQEHIPVAVHTE